MTSLVDVATAVIKQSDALRQLNSEKHLRDRVLEVSSTIATLATELASAASFAEQCAEGGITERPLVSPTAKTAVHQVEALAAAAVTDPLSVIGHHDLPTIRADATRATNELRAGGREAWREYCDRHVPVPQTGLIELVERRAGGPTASTEQLKHLDANLAVLRAMDPTDRPGSVSALLKTLKERGELWASFDLDHVPPAVRDFLDLCAADGAPLSQLSSEVTHWLDEEGLLDRYVVVPGDDA
ncbi:hypothetical protein [Terrabacter sp. Root181]|uniref:hypothetical protein n=1 Tax=Terrabacter sp. Root181 TaxID=1736484 RepID=UPI000AC75848|nr:hypothetical protein [Terrabacter sp. Root181]